MSKVVTGYKPELAAKYFNDESIDAMVVTSPENLFYVAGLPIRNAEYKLSLQAVSNAYPTFAVIDRDGEVHVVTWEYAVALRGSWVHEARGSSSREDSTGAALSYLREHVAKGAIGVEEGIPFYLYRLIKEAFPNSEVKLAGGVLAKLRLLKSDEEIAFLQRAISLAEDAITAVRVSLREGIDDYELLKIAKKAMLDGGAVGWNQVALAYGGRTGLSVPEGLAVKAGDLVTTDFGAIYEGYVSDITRQAYMGRTPPELVEVSAKLSKIQQLCVDRISPGIKVSEIFDFAKLAYEKENLVLQSKMVGHCIGMVTEEWPLFEGGQNVAFQEGMTFVIELGYVTPTQKRVALEDTFVLGSSGPRRLSSLDRSILGIQ